MRISWNKRLNIVLDCSIDCNKSHASANMEKYAWEHPKKLQKSIIFALTLHESTNFWKKSSYIQAVLHSS